MVEVAPAPSPAPPTGGCAVVPLRMGAAAAVRAPAHRRTVLCKDDSCSHIVIPLFRRMPLQHLATRSQGLRAAPVVAGLVRRSVCPHCARLGQRGLATKTAHDKKCYVRAAAKAAAVALDETEAFAPQQCLHLCGNRCSLTADKTRQRCRHFSLEHTCRLHGIVAAAMMRVAKGVTAHSKRSQTAAHPHSTAMSPARTAAAAAKKLTLLAARKALRRCFTSARGRRTAAMMNWVSRLGRPSRVGRDHHLARNTRSSRCRDHSKHFLTFTERSVRCRAARWAVSGRASAPLARTRAVPALLPCCVPPLELGETAPLPF